MSAQSIARKLIKAWQKEGELALSPEGVVGDGLSELIDEALVLECLQESLKAAISLGINPRAIGILNREGERKACLHMWDPKNLGKEDMECFLLAIPCSGGALEFNQWLQEADNRHHLTQAARRHVALLANLKEEDVERVETFPLLLPPPLISKLTAEARRALLMDLLEGGKGTLAQALLQQAMPVQPVDQDAPVILTEGVLMLAVAATTRWGQDIDDFSSEQGRVDELAFGNMDSDFLEQSARIWDTHMESLKVPGMAQVSQPVSVNEALMDTLHAGLMTLRFNMIPIQILEETAAAGEKVQLPQIQHLAVSFTDHGSVQLEIHSEYGQMVAELNTDWAMVEGEESFRATLASSLELDEDRWRTTADTQGPEQPDPSPEDAVGDHPAWARALPAPKGMN